MNATHTPDAPSSNAGLLTPEQEEELHEVAQSRSESNQRGRRALMLLHLHAGKTQGEVAALFFVAVRTVRYLVQDFRERGLEALDLRRSTQRRGKLTPEQECELRERWHEDPPRHAEEARDQVQERYGVKYTVRGMTKVLKRLGFLYRKPRRTPKVADEEAQREFVRRPTASSRRTCRTTRPSSSSTRCIRSIRSGPPRAGARRSWKPAVRAASGRNRVNVLGSVDLATGDFRGEVVRLGNVNGSHVRVHVPDGAGHVPPPPAQDPRLPGQRGLQPLGGGRGTRRGRAAAAASSCTSCRPTRRT